MPEPRDVHRASTMLMSIVLVALGIGMLVSTIARGGGPLTLGVLLGVLFVGAGGGRLWLTRRGA